MLKTMYFILTKLYFLLLVSVVIIQAYKKKNVSKRPPVLLKVSVKHFIDRVGCLMFQRY